MSIRKPILAAVVLSLGITGPALVAASDGGSGRSYDQDKAQNRGRGNNQGNHGTHGNQGQGGEDLTRMRFAGMDRNHDGQITRSEWRGNTTSFNQHDWNGDGVLSGIEVTPGAQRPGSGSQNDQFDRLDRNDDGRISLSEWPGDRNRFERLDLNDDGFLSRDELRAGNQGNNGNNGINDEFDRLDRNDDGRIALSEWPGTSAAFNRLDRNGDGFLSRDEFKRSRGAGDDNDDDDDDDDNDDDDGR